ncbi:MAG: hypothetical protein GY716_23745 [bacterium]|nr:hypothetical protein [bacterium]
MNARSWGFVTIRVLFAGLILGLVWGSGIAGTRRAPASSWMTSVTDEIRDAEYRFSALDAETWTAPNRRNHLRSTITGDGLRLEPRDPAGGEWDVRLGLVGIGRGETWIQPGPARMAASGNRVQLMRGALTEWFVNDRAGLEHGFTVPADPIRDESGPLALRLEVGSACRAELRADGQAIVFSSAASGDDVLRYAELVAWDANERRLDSRFHVRDGFVEIVVDDREAVYPLLIDPLATASWTVEGVQFDEEMGISVASAGDVNGDNFDDVIVGADEYDNGEISEGRAFVYYGSGSGLSLSPDWFAESNQSASDFGVDVASAGDVNGDGYDDVVIGAHKYDNGQSNEGAVFVYYGSDAGLGLPGNTRPEGMPTNADWFAEGDLDGIDFGFAVAGAGDVNNDTFDDIVIGADEYANGQSFEGGAFVYHGSADGLGLAGNSRPKGNTANADWSGESNSVDADYGFSVAGAGDVNNDGFDDILVGAWKESVNKLAEGRVYLYRGAFNGVQPVAVWTFKGDQDYANLAISVAGAGDVNNDGFDDIVVGSDGFDAGEVNEGKVFVFYGQAGWPAATPDWTAESDQGSAWLGTAVASAGDFNGDDIDDIILGAYRYDNGEIDEGAAFVYLGSDLGLGATPTTTMESNQPSAQFGRAVAGAGDVDGDGFDDLLVGAEEWDSAPDLCLNQLCTIGGGICSSDLDCAGAGDFCLGACSVSLGPCGMDLDCPGGDQGVALLYSGCADLDRDGVCSVDDNCDNVSNPDQDDADGDGLGDPCDACTDIDTDDVCDSELILVESSGLGEEVLVEAGAPLRYLANSSDPALGVTWKEELFDDSGAPWGDGFYGIGYEAGSGAENLVTGTTVASTSVSLYTRADFEITNLLAVQSVFLGVDYDDGFVAYINGFEVLRSPEMPVGNPPWNAQSGAHESSNGVVPNYAPLQDISDDALAALKTGTNVLAIGVWNTGAGSSDLVLVPRLSINKPEATTVTYLANTSDPGIGADWIQPGFNDTDWPRGNYGVGYEAGSGAEFLINTAILPGAHSIYTRTKFNVAVSAVERVLLGADYDDGYAAYINGVEVFRSPEIGPSPAWNTNASPHESSNGVEPDYSPIHDITSVARPILLNGENVLAIGVYNNNAPADDDLLIVPKLSVAAAVLDNCLGVHNPEQVDTDMDGLGDACDPDIDNDGVENASDNCPTVQNPPEDCDNNGGTPDEQCDTDMDGLGNACDDCPVDPFNDQDGDGLCANEDNCPTVPNPGQENSDPDGLGDACDPDDDNDGVIDENDNCPLDPNPPEDCDSNGGTPDEQCDDDDDTVGNPCDCLPTDGDVWGTPDAVSTLVVSHNPGTGVSSLTWQTPVEVGGNTPAYDTVRAASASAFGAGTCIDSDGADTVSTDNVDPASSAASYFLVRIENTCPTDNTAMLPDGDGDDRTVAACP